MKMSVYVAEIKHAAETVVAAIWTEHNQLLEFEQRLVALRGRVTSEYEGARSLAQDSTEPDDVALATGRHWETYFGSDRERHNTEIDINALRTTIDVHKFSEAALATALLQFGKQGVSIVHGGLSRCPTGRPIGTQVLREVLWQSRNQALHWEEDVLRPGVRNCFEALALEIHPHFEQYPSRNMAFDVVELLNWRTFASFEQDMMSLA